MYLCIFQPGVYHSVFLLCMLRQGPILRISSVGLLPSCICLLHTERSRHGNTSSSPRRRRSKGSTTQASNICLACSSKFHCLESNACFARVRFTFPLAKQFWVSICMSGSSYSVSELILLFRMLFFSGFSCWCLMCCSLVSHIVITLLVSSRALAGGCSGQGVARTGTYLRMLLYMCNTGQ